MKLSRVGELPLLEILRKRFGVRQRGLVLGIGDDAAAVQATGTMLLTTDMMVEGVHFDMKWTTAFQLGFKLVSVNVSDIFAMGGNPAFILLDFSARSDCSTVFFDRFFDGIDAALRRYGISLIGGDISASEKIMLSITAVGTARKIIRRSGAQSGDRIYVTGTLGDSACGLAILKKTAKTIDFDRPCRHSLPVPWQIAYPLMRRHLLPEARDAARYTDKATAMIDISDGLLIDLSRLCKESGAGAVIREQDIPVSDELREAAARLDLSPRELALSGGEDYELLFTAPPDVRVGAHCIGEITGRKVVVLDAQGGKIRVSSKGFQHFSLQR